MTVKKKATKMIWTFISIMLGFTVLSKTIYRYLLPTVQLDDISSGKIESKIMLEGKVCQDQNLIEQRSIPLVTQQQGKVNALTAQEGDEIVRGETLLTIDSTLNPKNQKEIQLLEIELNEQKEETLREKDLIQQNLAIVLKEYDKKIQEIKDILTSNEVKKLEKEIKNQAVIVTVNEELYEVGSISKKDYENAKDQLQTKKQEKKQYILECQEDIQKEITQIGLKVSQLKSQLAALTEQFKGINEKIKINQLNSNIESIYAPIDGYMLQLDVCEGAWVNAYQEFGKIIPKDIPIRLIFTLPFSQIDKVEIGQVIEWTLDQKERKATVVQKKNDWLKESCTVSCELSQEVIQELALKRGVYKIVSIQIQEKSEEYTYVVPNSAIFHEGNEAYIYIAKQEKNLWNEKYSANKMQVKLLQEGDYYTAIEATLPSPCKVIIQSSKPLQDGIEVKQR